MFGLGKKHWEEAPTFQEGDIVSYTTQDGEADTARVRRVYAGELELVNRERGYQRVPLECIAGATKDGHVDGTSSYCGMCRWVLLSHFPHYH